MAVKNENENKRTENDPNMPPTQSTKSKQPPKS